MGFLQSCIVNCYIMEKISVTWTKYLLNKTAFRHWPIEDFDKFSNDQQTRILGEVLEFWLIMST